MANNATSPLKSSTTNSPENPGSALSTLEPPLSPTDSVKSATEVLLAYSNNFPQLNQNYTLSGNEKEDSHLMEHISASLKRNRDNDHNEKTSTDARDLEHRHHNKRSSKSNNKKSPHTSAHSPNCNLDHDTHFNHHYCFNNRQQLYCIQLLS